VVRLSGLVPGVVHGFAVPGQDRLRSEVTASGRVPVVLLVVMVALLLVALGAFGRSSRVRLAAAALLLPASLAWVLFNGRLEGAVLAPLTAGHGITVSDLLGVVGVGVATVVLLRR
jgi:hypothetical protein